MTKYLWLFVLIFGAAASLRAATPADSKISAVTVFPDGAVITRVATVAVTAGAEEILFQHLPKALADDSLQVSGHGTAQATIVDVIAYRRRLALAPNPRIRALDGEIDSLQQQRRVVTDRNATLEREQALLAQIATDAATPPVSAGDSAGTRPGLAEWQQVMDFYDTGLEKIAREERALDRRRDELDAKIAVLNAESDQLRSADENDVKDVLVRLSVERAGSLEVTLSYRVSGAHWSPNYDARLATADKKLTLNYFGTISQNTGEDWAGVSLTLSTAHPSAGGAAPELPAWIVAQREPLARGVPVMSPFDVSAITDKGYLKTNSTSGSSMGVIGGWVSGSMIVRQQTAAVDIESTSAAFHIPLPADVPSDEASHQVGIATLSLDAQVSYCSTPKLSPIAFLTAAVTNGPDYPLLRGSVAAFLDGMFVAKTELETVMPGQAFHLAFGADDGIRIERKLINRFTQGVGLVTDQTRVNYEVLTTVTNDKAVPVTIALTDQIPLSRHEKIQVEQIQPDPAEIKPDDQGRLTWTLTLQPGEKRELPLKFTVTYPKNFPVTGLE